MEAPPVQEVQQVALQYARIDAQDAAKWKKKAKVAAALPRLQFDYGGLFRNNVNVNVNENVYVGSDNVVIGPEEGSYKSSADTSHDIGIRAVWALNELIFTRDSLYVSREALNIMRERAALLNAVNQHYFDRKKLIGEMEELRKMKVQGAEIKKKEHALFLKGLAMEKESAALDALTGGWFSSQLTATR